MSSMLDMLNAFNGGKDNKKQDHEKIKQQRIEKAKKAEQAKLEQEAAKAAEEAKLKASRDAEERDRIKRERIEAAEKAQREAEEAARPKVTFVMTACGRPDLMEKTLDSFFKFNDYPIERYIITEDSADPEIFKECKRLNDTKYQNKLEFVFNEKKLGQSKSIDLAYSMVETEFVFHCEEDWEFYNPNFIQESLRVLNGDETVLQAWIRPKSDKILNEIKPETYEIDGVRVRDVLPKSFMVKDALPGGKDLIVRDYMGFSWNPGVKRMADYELLKNGYAGFTQEHMIDGFYRAHDKGFRVVSISDHDEDGFVRHIGWGRRADDPVYNEEDMAPKDLEEAMLEARKKREEDKKRVEAEAAARAEAEASKKAAEDAGVKMPKVSVVMQVYLGHYPGAREDAVIKFHRAVQSFLNQSYKNAELIIASDGCKITMEHYEKYYADNKLVKFVYVDKKGLPNMYEERLEGYRYYRGVPREAGRSLADGELITYMDSDDYLHPKFLYEIVYNYNLAPAECKWYLNNAWYDHVNILSQPLANILEEYTADNIINVPVLKAKFIKTQVKQGLIVNTPWLLVHDADIVTKWKDTFGQTSEDVDFGRRLREDYKGLGYLFSAPTYLRCHYTGLWDV